MTKKISNECLADFLDEGFNQTQIAKICAMSRQAIHQRITYVAKRNEIRMRQYSVIFLRRLGFSISEIMNFTRYCRTTVIKLLRAAGYSSNEDYYQHSKRMKVKRFEISFLHVIGFSVPDIVKLTTYNINTIKTYLYKDGYSLKGRDST